MKRSIIQGWGGELFIADGVRFHPVDSTLVSTATESSANGALKLSDTRPSSTPYDAAFFGGINTWYPGAYANHKALSIHKGKVYQALNVASESNGQVYLGYWDGSGMFTHGGSAYSTSPGRCGRGFCFISPSGSITAKSSDLGIIEHNGNIFFIGAFRGTIVNNPWVSKFGWATTDETAHVAKDRSYRTWSVTSNNKKLISPSTTFLPDVTRYSHLDCCDLLSVDADIYYVNWVDTLKFPGGSGTPILVHSDIAHPTSKCLCIWPSGGFVNGVSNGERRIFALHGSGVLHRITDNGLETQVDFTNVRSFVARDTDNFSARINSNVDEPQRSCLLIKNNNKLHSFVITAASGYTHFECTGSPSGTASWIDKTDSLPEAIKSNDGCIYGYTDEDNNRLVVAHTTWGNAGIYGILGVNKSAGATSIYEYDTEWKKISEGMLGWPSRGIFQYNNAGPAVHVPSGSNPTVYPAKDYALVEYTVLDHYSRNVDVDVEYSKDAGLSWAEARRFRDYTSRQLLGSGVKNLPTSPAGITYPFYWDFVNDVGYNTKKHCFIRVRPRLVK